MSKYSRAFLRDYDFYVANIERFTFCGRHVPLAERGEMTPKKAFLVYDSQGKMMPCRDPGFLKMLIICKASVNLHVKMWAHGIVCGVLGKPELDEYLSGISAPEWVYRAIIGQVIKCCA